MSGCGRGARLPFEALFPLEVPCPFWRCVGVPPDDGGSCRHPRRHHPPSSARGGGVVQVGRPGRTMVTTTKPATAANTRAATARLALLAPDDRKGTIGPPTMANPRARRHTLLRSLRGAMPAQRPETVSAQSGASSFPSPTRRARSAAPCRGTRRRSSDCRGSKPPASTRCLPSPIERGSIPSAWRSP